MRKLEWSKYKSTTYTVLNNRICVNIYMLSELKVYQKIHKQKHFYFKYFKFLKMHTKYMGLKKQKVRLRFCFNHALCWVCS